MRVIDDSVPRFVARKRSCERRRLAPARAPGDTGWSDARPTLCDGPMSNRSLVVLLAVLGAGNARAAGYYVDEQGAKASGKAGAFVADASDPTAITYNPAGIAGLSGMQVYLGTSLIVPTVSFADALRGRRPAPVSRVLSPTRRLAAARSRPFPTCT